MKTLVRDMIRQLNVSLRNMKVYAADHPTAAASFQKSYDALKALLDQKGELALGIVENTLMVDESPLEESDTLIVKFAEELHARNIESLVFYRDISQEEFKAFITCLKDDPDHLMAQGGVQKRFEDHGITHVIANEVKYGKIGQSSEGGEGLEEAVLSVFLMGKMSLVRGDQKEFLSLMENGPGEVGAMINAGLAGMREKGEGEEELARAANRSVGRMGRFLEAQPGGWEKYANAMTQVILSLNPEAQADLYRSRATQEDYPQDRIDSLVAEFKDEEVIRLICNVYQGGLRSPEALARVATRVVPALERREKIAPDLGRELMKVGMEKEGWKSLRDEILWDTYALNQKVNHLASKAQLSKRDMDRVKQLGPDLAGEKHGGTIKSLLKALLAALKADDPEVRVIAAGYLPEYQGIVEDSGKFKDVGLFFCQSLIARLRKEPEERVKESILVSTAVILKKEILKSHFNTAARGILTLSKLGYLEQLMNRSDSLVSQDVADQVIAAIGGEEETQQKEGLVLLKLFGKSVLESVLFALEREENQETRRRLFGVVRSMGPEVIGEIVNRLADKRWYVVQTALQVLGEIGDKTISPQLMTSSVYHDDIRVRKEAIKTLGKLKSRGAVRVLCELLGDKDEEIRLLVLRTLGEVGDKMAVPHLLPFLEKKKIKGQKSEMLRQTAIEVLGRIGDVRAIPALLDLMRSRGFFRKEDEGIRKSVVEALGAFESPELEGVFQTVIQKDSHAAVRQAAQRALRNLTTSEQRASV